MTAGSVWCLRLHLAIWSKTQVLSFILNYMRFLGPVMSWCLENPRLHQQRIPSRAFHLWNKLLSVMWQSAVAWQLKSRPFGRTKISVVLRNNADALSSRYKYGSCCQHRQLRGCFPFDMKYRHAYIMTRVLNNVYSLINSSSSVIWSISILLTVINN